MKIIFIKILVLIFCSIWVGVFISKELIMDAIVQLLVITGFCVSLFYDLQELKNENPS